MATQFCEASFNYIKDMPVGDDRTSAFKKPVLNGREATLPGWDEIGFELMNHPSAVTDWGDDEAIIATHYEEIRTFAKALTGCDHALVGGHIKRGPDQAKIHEDLAPISFVHSDFAESYGDLMRQYYGVDTPEVAISLSKSGATFEDVKLSSRLMILQFWRNLGEPKMDLPLAFCDARTVTKKDLRPFLVEDYAGDGFNFDTLGIAESDAHEWYAFPEMTRDEVVVFRTYDSALIDSDQPFWTPHSAFADPSVEPGKPSRLSIELRATCIFK